MHYWMIERGNLDDPKHKWLYGKPDYSVVNLEYLKNRTQSHAADSLEKIVENLVKTWEMETQHKDSAYFQILFYLTNSCYIGWISRISKNSYLGGIKRIFENYQIKKAFWRHPRIGLLSIQKFLLANQMAEKFMMPKNSPRLEAITGYWIHAQRIFMIIQRKVSIGHFSQLFRGQVGSHNSRW